MSNNKATGEDGIQLELIKYGPDILINEIADAINWTVENHSDTLNIGKSVLLPTLKPKKTPGPVKNLRPINLLNTIRKILSTVTLNRINSKVDEYLSQSQAAYRQNRSTTDIVWAHRFIIAKAQLYKDIEVKITGIDMSSAFDTIDRKLLLDELSTILNEDELRLCRLLLSNTTMSLQFG